jgi:hypothetical protein
MNSPAQEPPAPSQSTPAPKDLLIALRQQEPGHLLVATSLLDRGIDINGFHEFPKNVRTGSGAVDPRTRVTALYDAAQRGDYEAVQFLTSRGADVRTRNHTGMAFHFGLFPEKNIETLCALDGMRTSKNLRIVQLAEGMYGVETEEEFVRRRDAFDELMGPRRLRPLELQKSTKRRVKSVLPKSSAKSSAKKSQVGHVSSAGTEESEGRRYDLRSRNSNLSYA